MNDCQSSSDMPCPQSGEHSLRILVCSNQGDGKSTLIEHLLTESGQPQACPIVTDSHDAPPVYQVLADEKRRLLFVDIPSHKHCPRQLAASAATADLALLIVDAGTGLTSQSRLHMRILSMMGVRQIILVVNKMDLSGFAQPPFDAAAQQCRELAADLGLPGVRAIPLCALSGDNLRQSGPHMPWYQGPTLLEALEQSTAGEIPAQMAMRLPVQGTDQSDPALRNLSGRLAAGFIRPGDAVRILPSGVQTRIETLRVEGRVRQRADCGETVALTLAEPVEIRPGDVLVAAEAPPEVADQFEARLLWLGEQPMAPGRQYLMKLADQEVTATVTLIKYREDIDSGAHLAAKTLEQNAIATVNLSTRSPLVFEPHALNHVLGGFTLVDRLSLETVGTGTIDFALRRASNIHWQALEIDKGARASLMRQRPRCVWFTGLSGSGKSTIANLLEKRLHAAGRHTYVLDGDNVRHGLNRDLGFTEADRVENIRRVAEVAKLMTDAGLIVLVSFISPFISERDMARSLFAADEFIEVFVDTPLEECERRDVKGLYAKARRGELKNFTGIDSAYEPPLSPDIHLHPTENGPQDCVETLMGLLD